MFKTEGFNRNIFRGIRAIWGLTFSIHCCIFGSDLILKSKGREFHSLFCFYMKYMQGFQAVKAELEQMLRKDFPDVFLVDISLKRSVGSVLSISLDTDEGISVGTCALISRKLNFFLEKEDPFEFPFRLEVSSPGVGKPLVLQRQYLKNVGRKIKVILADDEFKWGKLISVNEVGIVIEPSKSGKKSKEKIEVQESLEISYSDIKESIIEISFD